MSTAASNNEAPRDERDPYVKPELTTLSAGRADSKASPATLEEGPTIGPS